MSIIDELRQGRLTYPQALILSISELEIMRKLDPEPRRGETEPQSYFIKRHANWQANRRGWLFAETACRAEFGQLELKIQANALDWINARTGAGANFDRRQA